jgi:acyl-CoA synthetase (AMP-forming)/AMP-acid ligase II
MGDKAALIDAATGTTVSFTEMASSIRALAGAFAARGLKQGDVIGLFSTNSIAYPVVFHAATRAGLTITTLNALYTPKDIALQLKDAGAKLLITISPFLDRAVAGAEQAGITDILVCDRAEGYESIEDLIAQGHPAPEGIAIDPANDVAVLPYSSGTTGLPKGVMLTHRNLVANIVQIGTTAEIGDDDVTLAVLPFFHIYGMQVLMNAGLAYGATIVTMAKFDLGPYLTAMEKYGVTRAYVAPPIVVALAKAPQVDDHDLSKVKAIFSGAAPLDRELAEAASKRLGVPVVQGYGMTEMSPVSHMTAHTDASADPGSVGQLVPNCEARLVDYETGQDAEPGGTGELWVRGPMVMKGYLNRPEATADMLTDEGWLKTGDVAHIDDEGYTYIVDRVKELIKYKGYQVAPAELEAELLTSPDIADAAVIGATVDGEEVPKAFVVRAASAPELSEQDVMSYIEARVSPHKKVRLVEFIDAIPKSASGKILRKDLRR